MEDYINTYTGKRVDFLEPKTDQIDIIDIAYALSRTVRWGGHCSPEISVAQHSVIVAEILEMAGCDPVIVAQGLMHDSAEAYIPDIPSPIKPYLGGLRDMEHGLERVIFERFGIPYPMHELVKAADEESFRWEYRDCMAGDTIAPPVVDRPLMRGLHPNEAEYLFLQKVSTLSQVTEGLWTQPSAG